MHVKGRMIISNVNGNENETMTTGISKKYLLPSAHGRIGKVSQQTFYVVIMSRSAV